MAALVVLVGVAGLAVPGASDAQPAPPSPAPSAPVPEPPTPPCQGPGCIPQPVPVPPANEPPGYQPNPIQAPVEESSCGITNIPACVADAIEAFFRDLVTPGLNSLLDLLAKSLLVTPQLDQLPVMGQIWGSSQQIVIAVYATLTLAAGIIVMAYESLQTRNSIKEILPRVIVGFLASNLSLFFGGKVIEIGNALSQAILGDQLSPEIAARAMTDTLMHDLNGGSLFVIFIALALIVMLVAVLLTYIVRITLTIILLAGAPLFLMCHALPHTEGIAMWWWKAFAGVIAIQVGQSLALVGAIKLFFWPGGITLFS
ncbi:hypothetical protein [Saccharopolyspora antimicrobica]|uniref:hypothetical protein n=1 Tax=Saccharopolyspora antimicrobica TaxID=455193 RepID=UPI00210CBBB5|nr:hypothetical protein [Saccharopolyspora antimicrobica]